MHVYIPTWLIVAAVIVAPVLITIVVNRLSGEDDPGWLSVPLMTFLAFGLSAGACWTGLIVWWAMR